MHKPLFPIQLNVVLILLGLSTSLVPTTVMATSATAASVEYTYEGIAHAGPMAIDAVLNKWKGNRYNEDDG
ncbi:MAG: hypothetical protein VW274_08855, partial [Thalassolituus sp.]